ncbi:hypothetical protein SNE35_00925 [Paucibacter sp. R3-3]|uniref:Rhodanese domain-containing protein n=1 Tax=Roseateles agri TaxID=3098619 RepID=A0ABU5D9U5_9BURK|nr:hypothetical protein [Paucibacter sp. R3-3]MDY0743042.1 hypothetical protein [Paucibacter sp. R3-3]
MTTIKRTLPAAVLAALALLAAAGTARADNLAAPAAEAALAHGALAWDVREQPAAALPGALRIDPAALTAWLERHDLVALRGAVSAAGLDLSRDIVVYGDAGDPRAQALVESLQALSPGQVHWFVGGAAEWAMSGRELRATTGSRLPVPQWLVSPVAEGPKTMAAAALRSPALAEADQALVASAR